ncbi:MAG: AI-2E family transporter, partial [Luteolibacter sp.]
AAAVNFQEPGKLVIVPVVYFALTAIEGNFVTPMALGGRFRINPLVIFVWIFAWAGFWEISGILIAMPALVIFKIFCENTEKMEVVRRVLSA